jgi:hypothetical protein
MNTIERSNIARHRARYFMIDTDMGRTVIYLISPNDDLITIDLSTDPMYPGGMPLHTLILPNGHKAYLTTMSSDTEPATILVLRIRNIDWNARTADVNITKVLKAEEPASPPSILVPSAVAGSNQPITPLWIPNNQQIHGPTLHPNGRYAYFTEWTDNKIRVVDTRRDEFARVDPIEQSTLTRQLHGVFFNPRGTKALSPAYYFDLNYVLVYDVGKTNGDLSISDVIPLSEDESKSYAAFTHFVTWIDNRHAITSAQQLGPTSLTPSEFSIIGPSVWTIDTRTREVKMIIGPTNSPGGNGIYKPASDTAVIGNKLYVSEEDSMDDQINNDGYVSIWDIEDTDSPTLIKTLTPGNGLPQDFELGHALYPTPDGRYIYVQSWHSGHLVKIDTSSDQTVKVFDKNNSGFIQPHGGFITGTIR